AGPGRAAAARGRSQAVRDGGGLLHDRGRHRVGPRRPRRAWRIRRGRPPGGPARNNGPGTPRRGGRAVTGDPAAVGSRKGRCGVNFVEQPPSKQWAALKYRGDKFAEVWFKPEGKPFALTFRIPRESFHVPGVGQRLTTENLLKAVGIATGEV